MLVNGIRISAHYHHLILWKDNEIHLMLDELIPKKAAFVGNRVFQPEMQRSGVTSSLTQSPSVVGLQLLKHAFDLRPVSSPGASVRKAGAAVLLDLPLQQ